MNSKLTTPTLAVFLLAFFAPVWTVAISLSGSNAEAQQYSGLQTALMGVYNLVVVVPALICLLLGKKSQIFYVNSLILSVISIVAMCWWAFGAGQ